MKGSRSRRGFTLIELMVSMGVVVFCISLVLGLFVSQQKAFASLDLVRVATEAGRDASLDFETSLRRAGWGIDPRYAFDFKNYACATTPCRDSATAPDSIVFYSRNPNYHWDPNGANGCTNAKGCFTGKGWLVTAAGGGSITLSTRVNDVIEQGQIILLTLDNGAPPAPPGTPTPAGSAPVMATVAARMSATTTSTSVTLTTHVANDPYQNTNGVTGSYPVTTGGTSPPVYAFLVDRYAYSIATYGGSPYLMLDTGLTKQVNGSPVAEVVPVAKNVEDLQIAYVLNTPIAGGTGPDNNANWIVGDTSGVQEEPNPAAQAPNPDYIGAAVNDPSRFTLHPANVRMVRFEMVVRSYRPDPSPDASWAGDPFPAQENRGAASAPALGRYRRVVVSGSVATRNLESRNPFVF